MLRNKSSSYKDIPTSEPELFVAVATPAVEKTRSTDLTSADSFFYQDDDIVTVFKHDSESRRNHQLNKCGVAIGVAIGMTCLWMGLVIGLSHLGDEDFPWFPMLACLAASVGIGILCCNGVCRPCFDRILSHYPCTHTAVTTSGIRHVIEGDKGGGEYDS